MGTPSGCLFDLEADPAEHDDLAAALPETFDAMLRTFMSYNASYHPPVENPPYENVAFCAQVCTRLIRCSTCLIVL